MMNIRKSLLLASIFSTLLMVGCGGGSSPDATASSDESAFTPNFDDVVMADAPAEEVAPATDAAPPEDSAAPASTEDAEAAMLARMTPKERAEYEEKIKPVKEAAAGESQSNAVLLGDIRQAVEGYFNDYGKLPPDMGVLRKEGYLRYTPKLPAGKRVRINGKTCKVSIE